MILKVCGLKDNQNVEQLLAVKPNLMGFIFYSKSKRFVTQLPPSALTNKGTSFKDCKRHKTIPRPTAGLRNRVCPASALTL